jgi:hypothetical protein
MPLRPRHLGESFVPRRADGRLSDHMGRLRARLKYAISLATATAMAGKTA